MRRRRSRTAESGIPHRIATIVLVLLSLLAAPSFAQSPLCEIAVTKTCCLPPAPPPAASFVCSDAKPITSLTLIWDGPSGVNVVSEGGQSFAGVQHGQEITLSTAGLGNDVDVTLSGAVSGPSRFHVSCSDAAMNGAEDCGLRQGNGKDDKPERINDWRLEGMAGSAALDCTPPEPGVQTQTACGTTSAACRGEIASSFNGTPIPAGRFLWFNANFSASGIGPAATTITLRGATVELAGQSVAVPDAVVTFDPAATCATTAFDPAENRWETRVPLAGSDEIFLSGVAFPVGPGGLPGGLSPVTWRGSFGSDDPDVSLSWKWSAAVYTSFGDDLGALDVKPTHDRACAFANSHHAGTPEAFLDFVTGGARGGGGSNWTGSWSATKTLSLASCPNPEAGPLFRDACELPAGGGRVEYQYTVTNSASSPGAAAVSVEDDLDVTDGEPPLALGGPTLLAPGAGTTLFLTRTLVAPTFNRVRATGVLGTGEACTAATDLLGVSVGGVPPVGEPPTLAIVAPLEGALLGASPVVVSGSVTGADVSVQVNGVPATLAGTSFTASVPLAEGTNTLTATATNAFGTAQDSRTVTLDTLPPTVTIVTPAEGTATTLSLVQVTGSVADASAITAAQVAGAPASLTGASFEASVPLVLGSNAVLVTATDAAGNVGSATVTVLRGEPPTVEVQAPGAGAFLGASPVAVTGTANGAASVTVNGVAASLAGGSFSASVPLAEGSNTLTATAANAFGSAQDSREVTLDTTPPAVTILTPAGGSTLTSAAALVSGGVVDASPIVALALDGDPLPPGTAFSIHTVLAEGPNTLTVSATDAAGHVGSASVAVTVVTEEPLSITLDAPPTGALVSSAAITVAGSVSDSAATVRVNGVTATVTGHQFVAAAVPLAEGENLLTATATRGSETASASASVTFNAPPEVLITTPADGDVVRAELTDVAGVVDDLAAFLDVNGVVASVGSAGRFLARDVPLAAGENVLTARAIDPLGARGEDRVAVTRDEGAAGRLRIVLVDPVRHAFADVDEQAPLPVIIENVAEFRDSLAARAMPPPGFEAPIDAIQFGVPPAQRFFAYVFAEDPGEVQMPAASALFGNLEDTKALEPIEGLPDDFAFQFGLLDFSALEDLVPGDFEPRYFARFDLHVVVDAPVPAGEIELSATSGTATASLLFVLDDHGVTSAITSPADGSVIAGASVTVTGTATSPLPLFGQALYRVRDGSYALLEEGTVPLVEGRFTIRNVVIGAGPHCIEVFTVDAGGSRSFALTCLESDPAAPAVSVVSPHDGEALLAAEATIDLNFAAPTTLVSVNGVPDGRSFAAGLQIGALTLRLALGPNPFTLELDAGAGVFTLAFTLFHADGLGSVRIVSPAAGAVLNTETATVTGTVPVGTPLVEVNGVLATLAADLARFTAEIPLPEPGLELVAGEVRAKPVTIRAVAYPFGQSASVEVGVDRGAPAFRAFLPEDGTATLDPAVAFAGWVSEAATVEVEGPGGLVSVRSVRDRAREREELLNLFGTRQFHRFDLPELPLLAGANALVLRATDAAGNRREVPLTIVQAEGALRLAAPAEGSSLPGLRTVVTLEALEGVTLRAWYAAGRRLPAFEGATLTEGLVTLPEIPLVPGANPMRVVYERAGGLPEVLTFSLASSATEVATVAGTVTDAQSGAPIGGAQVFLTVGGTTLVAVTGADGSYAVQVEPGAVSGVTSAEGFATASFSASPAAGETAEVDSALAPTGLPSRLNEVAIVVPPAGTVTDFEALTVVGKVLNPASTVGVNGTPATVVGNRFTAKGVPLAMGANTLTVTALVPGSPTVTKSVSVERSDEPVLDVEIFSPPDGATVPGSGLVVRGFVSAKDARTLVTGGFAPVSEGVFEVRDVVVAQGSHPVEAITQTRDGLQSDEDVVQIDVASVEPALFLDADPPSGIAPLDVNFSVLYGVAPFPLERIDFDLDGDGRLDVLDAPSSSVVATVSDPHPVVARAYATTPRGVELTATVRVSAHTAASILREFAHGNPVDLAPAPGGHVYVLDAAAGSIARYTPDGALVSVFGASGAGPDQLASPQALAVAADGRIFVADTGNDRIQIFAADGTHLGSLGSTGAGSGELRGPRGIELEGESVIVADAGNGRIQSLAPDGFVERVVSLADPRGMDSFGAHGVMIASPTRGLRAFAEASLRVPERLLDPHLAALLTSPVDVSASDSGLYVAEASGARVVILDQDLRLRRVVLDLERAPRAVLASSRREIETVLVADGTRVLEIALPTASPVPVVESLKEHLATGDVAGALALVHPLRREHFEELYRSIEADLPVDAAAMQGFTIDLLREEQAIVRIQSSLIVDGASVPREFPVYLIRAEDGTWQIFDY